MDSCRIIWTSALLPGQVLYYLGRSQLPKQVLHHLGRCYITCTGAILPDQVLLYLGTLDHLGEKQLL